MGDEYTVPGIYCTCIELLGVWMLISLYPYVLRALKRAVSPRQRPHLVAIALLTAVTTCQNGVVASPGSPITTTAASDDALKRIDIQLEPARDGIFISYGVHPARRSLELSRSSDTHWKALSPGFVLRNGEVSRINGQPFSKARIKLTPDLTIRDRTYPVIFPVGEGWQIHAPSLIPSGLDSSYHFSTTKLPVGFTLRLDATDGYIYLGPAKYVQHGSINWIFAPAVSTELQSDLRREAKQAVSYVSAKLKSPLHGSPTIIVSQIERGGVAWQGDAPTREQISLRFFMSSGHHAEELTQRVRAFLRHELFHLWNTGDATPNEGASPWLSEGMAEYSAILGDPSRPEWSEVLYRQELTMNLNSCRNISSDSKKAFSLSWSGKAIYSCGVLIQWLIDLQSRHHESPSRDIYDIWHDAFQSAAKRHDQYNFHDLVDASLSTDPSAAWLEALPTLYPDQFWSLVADKLDEFEVSIDPLVTANDYRTATVMHLLSQVCLGSYGFVPVGNDQIRLDTGTRCNQLNGDPTVDSVQSIDLTKDAKKAYLIVASLCAAKQRVELSSRGSTIGTVECRSTPTTPTGNWMVAKAPISFRQHLPHP